MPDTDPPSRPPLPPTADNTPAGADPTAGDLIIAAGLPAGDGLPAGAEHIEDLLIEDELKDCYLAYAMSVNVARAIPDVRDGLKPVQRRILYAMHRAGIRHETVKCARVVGDVMGKYHPHGDSSIYEALVRMAQPFSMRHPLVHPQGNFGSDDGDPPAAMRYTECRIARIAEELLADLDEDTVDWQPNFDEKEQEPRVLPAGMPNLLVNGSSGIGVAMATNIPPHNLREICDALIHLSRTPDADVDDLMRFVQGPDFPTRGIICGRKGIVDAYRTGRGSITIRSRHHLEDIKGGGRRLVFTEFPYQVTRKSIVEKIAELVKEGRVAGIAGVNDASDRSGLKLHVELKRDADENVVVNHLFEFTELQHNFPVAMVALVNGRPRLLNLLEMLSEYLAHRREVVRRRTEFRLREARQKAHMREALILAIADIDEIIRTIKESRDTAAARAALMARPLRLTESATLKALLPEAFYRSATTEARHLTRPQADAILEMKLSRLTGLQIEELAAEYRDLQIAIDGHLRLLGDPAVLEATIVQELETLRETFGEERRSELGPPVGAVDIEDLIKEEEMVVTISHEGYAKRTPLTEYRARGRGTRGLTGAETKDGDFLEHLYVAGTHDHLLFFTNHGKVHWLRVFELPAGSRTGKGRPLANMLQIAEGEKPAAVLVVKDFDDRYVVMATARGLIKKTVLSAFSRPKKTGIIAIGLEDGDHLIGCALVQDGGDIVLGTREGMCIRFPESNVRPMGRPAYGVRGVSFRKVDEVVDMIVLSPEAAASVGGDPSETEPVPDGIPGTDGSPASAAPAPAETAKSPDGAAAGGPDVPAVLVGPDLLTVCENGFGKRTHHSEYRRQGRGGSGIINIKTTDRNGKVVALKAVADTDDLMLISSRGVLNRISVADLRSIGRATQGVKIMTLDTGDSVVAVAQVANPEPTPGGGDTPGDGGPATGTPGAGGPGTGSPAAGVPGTGGLPGDQPPPEQTVNA